MSCILAATVNRGSKNFEQLSFTNMMVMIFALMMVIVAGRIIYVPVRTGR